MYGGRPNWRQDIRGGNVSARERKYAWKNIYRGLLFFFSFFCLSRFGRRKRSVKVFVSVIKFFRYNLKMKISRSFKNRVKFFVMP